jgi:hypothetical protein
VNATLECPSRSLTTLTATPGKIESPLEQTFADHETARYVAKMQRLDPRSAREETQYRESSGVGMTGWSRRNDITRKFRGALAAAPLWDIAPSGGGTRRFPQPRRIDQKRREVSPSRC